MAGATTDQPYSSAHTHALTILTHVLAHPVLSSNAWHKAARGDGPEVGGGWVELWWAGVRGDVLHGFRVRCPGRGLKCVCGGGRAGEA